MRIVTNKYCDQCVDEILENIGFCTSDCHLNLDKAYDEIADLWNIYGIEKDENLTPDATVLKKQINEFIDKIMRLILFNDDESVNLNELEPDIINPEAVRQLTECASKIKDKSPEIDFDDDWGEEPMYMKNLDSRKEIMEFLISDPKIKY